jgi:putative NIF3 family GTP cyclohydrolase 1 type 2
VKKYTRFSEFKDAPAILESYGMHTNFDKACAIACINDPVIKERLFKEATPPELNSWQVNSSIVARPDLSESLRVEYKNNKTSLVTRLSGIRKIISAKIPHWRLLPNS